MSYAFDKFDKFDKSIAQDSRQVARASVVNRTHQVVRERAKTIAARRSRVRSLWIPWTARAGPTGTRPDDLSRPGG